MVLARKDSLIPPSSPIHFPTDSPASSDDKDQAPEELAPVYDKNEVVDQWEHEFLPVMTQKIVEYLP